MKKIILLTVLLLSCLHMASSQKIKLAFNPPQGATYQFTYEMIQDIKQVIAGNETGSKQNMKIVYTTEVLENKNNRIRMRYTYKDISFEMMNAQFSLKYKSNEPVEDNPYVRMISRMYNEMLNKQFEVTYAANGSVIEITGLEGIVEAVKKVFADESNEFINTLLESSLNEDAVKSMFEQAMMIYPDKELALGESWEVDQEVSAMMVQMNIHSRFTLESVTGKTAHVSTKSLIDGNMMNGEQEGTIEYNLETGIPQKLLLRQVLDSSMEMVTISLTSDIKMTLE